MNRRALHLLQRALLTVSYAVTGRRRSDERPISWVVGTVEIASMVASIAAAIPDSYSVCLERHRFFDDHYDFTISPGRFEWIRRVVLAPIELGRLARRASGVIYVGSAGFLLDDVDDRMREFEFLKRRGVTIVCYFVGSDIRSPQLLKAFEERTGIETIATYLSQVNPVFSTPEYDDQRRRVGEVADRYADLIFTAAVDQLGYLTRPTHPFLYFLPDDAVNDDLSRHQAPGPRVILHAPSSPIIKGTQVVRAAIARLRSEGYEFDYRELQGVPHEEVLRQLGEAHIVLNEFFAFVPGVFGVEAMAAGCALLTRADETIETGLPTGSNAAWSVTNTADLMANLRQLLDEPETIEPLARRGRQWVIDHATASAAGRVLNSTLDGASTAQAPPI